MDSTKLASENARLRKRCDYLWGVLQGVQRAAMSEPPGLDDTEEFPSIVVYEFHKAPKELRELSNNGGDEDWIAVVPAALKSKWIPWLETGSAFGCCQVYEYPLASGDEVRIGCHA